MQLNRVSGQKNQKPVSDIVKLIGKEEIRKIYDLADIYHSDNIDRVCDDLIEKYHITQGKFDPVSKCKYTIPTHWDIGKVYKRLILGVTEARSMDVVDALIEVFTSFIEEYIEDYNSSFYYENPSYILECYIQMQII